MTVVHAERDHDRQRVEVAEACRVLAHRGLVENILGHISLRVEGDGARDPDEAIALVRCRGPHERGLRFTLPADIRLVDLRSGRIVDDPSGRYRPPSELPIHTSILLARPDVGSVVHAHPPDVVTASLAGIELEPIFGAYDIPAAHLAAAGIPTHPRSVLIRTGELAAEMVASLGSAPALVLAGHGVVTTGADPAEATLRALQVDTLARFHLRVRQAGVVPSPIPAADRAELPDLGAGFNHDTLWRAHLAALAADGGSLDDETPADPPPDDGTPADPRPDDGATHARR